MTRVPYAVERDGSEVCLIIRGTVTPFRRGRTWGHPDTWYPDEGGEVEIDSVCVDPGNGIDGAAWTGELTDAESADVLDALRLAAEDDDQDAREHEAECRYEDTRDRGEW